MKSILTILLLISFTTAMAQLQKVDTTKGYIYVQWVDSLEGDYSFIKEWDYPEFVYKNEFGQLVQDGFRREETEHMTTAKNKIKRKYIEEYYKLVDTLRVFHTLECEVNAYEFGEAHYMNVQKKKHKNFYAYSLCNISTHSGLILYFRNDSCFAAINLLSIVPGGSAVFYATTGFVKIDKGEFEKGILKAEFDIKFKDNEPGEKDLLWKGKVYSPIRNEGMY